MAKIKRRRCSKCRGVGHNSATCKKKKTAKKKATRKKKKTAKKKATRKKKKATRKKTAKKKTTRKKKPRGAKTSRPTKSQFGGSKMDELDKMEYLMALDDWKADGYWTY
jgi:hypothetical protein